ncbi:MAG: hypothetical protein GY857_19585, partial [Desulfobacula sp.]|nr:hypothetical protein [Desulfobacula sp.]
MAVFNTSKRYYLNGIDWVMAALDRLNIKQTGLGNHSQLVLVLQGYLDKTKLAQRIAFVLSKNMFFKGSTRRAWHLAPYWAPEQHDFNPKDIRFFNLDPDHRVMDDSSMDDGSINKNLDQVLQDCAKTTFKDDKTLLGFDLIHCNNRSYLIMRFTHRMFDARGAERLLEYILDEKSSFRQYGLPSQSAQLNAWKSRFLSGQSINRFLRSIYSKKLNVAKAINTNGNDDTKKISNKARFNEKYTKDKHPCFHCSTFSRDQTDTIDDNAIKKAGYLMNGIFILSCVAKSFNSLFKQHKCLGDMLIPINVDLRETKFGTAKIFFNNVSFMLFKVEQNLSTANYIKSLKTQFIDQVKNKIPHHFINASLLMRIMPLKILS